jgi:hypothetical protein
MTQLGLLAMLDESVLLRLVDGLRCDVALAGHTKSVMQNPLTSSF